MLAFLESKFKARNTVETKLKSEVSFLECFLRRNSYIALWELIQWMKPKNIPFLYYVLDIKKKKYLLPLMSGFLGIWLASNMLMFFQDWNPLCQDIDVVASVSLAYSKEYTRTEKLWGMPCQARE